ncbi:MAG: hypothetical protein E7001_01625 [Coriobacteriaceae bacterium]|nr:hypothetical protein [Coriobacteriaceae bacterium]
MPSWNIHIAQTEELLARGGALARAVRDRNAFLFGNVVPDIMVGYMVPGVEEPIPYRITHFAAEEPIPKPREGEFWDTFVAPLLRGQGRLDAEGAAGIVPIRSIGEEQESLNRVHFPKRCAGAGAPAAPAAPDAAPSRCELRRSTLDLVLGAWAHLLADNLWNTRVNEYLDAHGGKPSEQFRIKKQADFDAFGRTRRIASVPQASERLLLAAEAFPQYPLKRRFVLEAVGVAHEIVRTNGGFEEHAAYRLLTDEFFANTFAEVLEATEARFAERAEISGHGA